MGSPVPKIGDQRFEQKAALSVHFKNEEKDQTPKATSKKTYVRRSIDLHPEAEEMLELLKDRLQVGSQTEVLRKAIQLLAIALGGKENEPTELFISKNNGSLTKIVIL